MKSALLRFAPVFTTAIIDNPKLARSLMVQAGALERIKRDEPIPVVVNHDMDRVVGTVREIRVFPDVDGGVVRDWYVASCDLVEPPDWLKVNGGVSWSHIPLRTQEVNETTRLLRGLIKEISLISPSIEPAEPFARVAWVGDATSSPTARSTTSHGLVADEIVLGPQRIVRRDIGQVLGVR